MVHGWQGHRDEDAPTPDDVVEKLDAVTENDVARVGQRLFQEEKLRLAVVGPHRSDKLFRKLLHF